MGLVRGCLGPAPEDKEYPTFFPAGPVGGCLRPAPEDKEYPVFFPAGPEGMCLRPAPEDGGNHVFFPFFFSLFGESFLEALKGQGPQCYGGRVEGPVSGCWDRRLKTKNIARFSLRDRWAGD